MRTFTILFMSLLTFSLWGQSPERKYTDHYYERLEQFKQEKPLDHNSIVMLGNSLVEFGDNWSVRLNNPNVANRGIIGDEIMGVYDRLDEIIQSQPKKVFLLIGINDVSYQLSVDSILQLEEQLIQRLCTKLPHTKVYLQSLLPINESFQRYRLLNGKTDMIPEINRGLRNLAKKYHISYISLFPKFKEKKSNSLRVELTTDGLHLNEAGYAIWIKKLKCKI